MVTTQIIYKMASLTVNGVECGPRNFFFFFFKIVSLQCVFDFCKFCLWKIVRELFSFFSPKKKKKSIKGLCVLWMNEGESAAYYTITPQLLCLRPTDLFASSGLLS